MFLALPAQVEGDLFTLAAVWRGKREGIRMPVVGGGMERAAGMAVGLLSWLPLRVPEELRVGMEEREGRLRVEVKPSTVTDGGRMFDGFGLTGTGNAVGDDGANVVDSEDGSEATVF